MGAVMTSKHASLERKRARRETLVFRYLFWLLRLALQSHSPAELTDQRARVGGERRMALNLILLLTNLIIGFVIGYSFHSAIAQRSDLG
jgi:hypothetical protein